MSVDSSNIPPRTQLVARLIEKVSGWVRSPVHLFILLCGLVPPVLVLTLMIQSPNMPFLDQWYTSYSIATLTQDGHLALGNLFAWHNEHRIVFTNLVTVLSTIFLHWNVRIELLVTFILALAILLVVLLLIRQTFSGITLVMVIPASALIFSIRGGHTWETSFQSGFLFAELFFLGALLILVSRPPAWRPLIIAAGLSICATFAINIGLVIWAALFVGLILLGYRNWKHLLLWIIIAGITWFIYSRGISLSDPGAFQTVITHPKEFLNFIILYLAAPLITNAPPTLTTENLIGFLSIIFFALNLLYLWIAEKKLSALAVWVVLGLFCVGAACLAGIARLDLFIQIPAAAFQQRYIIIPIFWWIALLAVSIQNVRQISTLSQRDAARNILYFFNLLGFVAVILLYDAAINDTLRSPIIVNPIAESCVAKYVVFKVKDTDCLQLARVDTPDVMLPKAVNTANRGLALFGERELDLPMTNIAPQIVRTGSNESFHTTIVHIGNSDLPAIFEHAPSLIQFSISIPASYQSAVLETSAYLPPENLTAHPEIPENGVDFSAFVSDNNVQTPLMNPLTIDPHTDKLPVPVRLDLSRYIGRTIWLQFQTDTRGDANFDWSMWLNPILKLYH
jgi:hypothetical protein